MVILQRTKTMSGKKNTWLLIKRHDQPKASVKKSLLPPKKKKRDPWPEKLSVQLAELTKQVPLGKNWLHEVKFDGYRTVSYLKKKKVQMRTRNGLDWTSKYEALAKEIQRKIKAESAIFDGEVVALDAEGKSSFFLLQEALSDGTSVSLKYYIFDLLYLNGVDLRNQPLEIRKQLLKKLLKSTGSQSLLYSEHWMAQGEELLEQACHHGLEGIVAKQKDSPYHAGRYGEWQKIKCSQRQELVIGGYTDPAGERQSFGALLMGVYENKKLRYVGRVGTGFDRHILKDLLEKLEPLEIEESPFQLESPNDSRSIHWVKPKLVAEVEFGSWTADGNVRHGVYQGLREDKMATEVRKEKAKRVSKIQSKKQNAKEKGFIVSHPDRLIYPKQKIKKIDVVNYYKSVAPWMLKHLVDRPFSLLRCPDEAGASCFFQKHANNPKLTAVGETIAEDESHKQEVMYINSEEGLLQLVQWGVLELHTWQCHKSKLDRPDQIIFDLDPDEKLEWDKVLEAAFRIKDLLKKLSLESYVKTTGGKGLHIHVPIAPIYNWDQIKSFSKSVTMQLESEYPKDYTTNISKKKRSGKIFLDYLRNGFGATAIAPYSLRAKNKPTVSVPLTWAEVRKLKKPDEFDLNSVLERLVRQKTDPWKGYDQMKQKIKILKPASSLKKSKSEKSDFDEKENSLF